MSLLEVALSVLACIAFCLVRARFRIRYQSPTGHRLEVEAEARAVVSSRDSPNDDLAEALPPPE